MEPYASNQRAMGSTLSKDCLSPDKSLGEAVPVAVRVMMRSISEMFCKSAVKSATAD